MRRAPKQGRSQEKVQTILKAARNVLIQRGYEGFTTNHVAQAAGCNIGTLYRYFPEKNEIIKHLYQDWLAGEAKENQRFTATLTRPVDPAEFVAALFRHHLDLHDEDEHTLSIELTKALHLNSELRDVDQTYETALVDIVTRHLHDYTDHQFTPAQIAFALKLSVSLLVMINLTQPEERAPMEAMAIDSLKATVRSFYIPATEGS